MKTDNQLDPFTRGYLHALLWSTNDESTPAGGVPMDDNYSIDDFAPETIERAAADCKRFQDENAITLEVANISDGGDTPSRAGFLFWLTRNGHGSGFWDEKTHSDPEGERLACRALSEASNAFGKLWPCVGDDGKIYF